jgi:hypothetical protein
MRFPFVAFSLAALVLTFSGLSVQAEKVRCSAIRDSAMCVAEPTCWYDAVNNKGCLDGPRPDENRCAVHSGESTCNVSTLGCTWNAAEEKCLTKAE